jgi:glycosyltransferase involved in cell wall biosynthesis
MSAQIGIGIITYNRLASLQACVEAVQTRTQTPFQLVIADDGSADGTVDWARQAGLPLITGANWGPSWNKNRALYFFMARTDCDPVLILEDDTHPAVAGWEQPWCAAARRWHHVNWIAEPREGGRPPGSGTAEDPWHSYAFGGQCTAGTREGMRRVGYLDTRFVGFSEEHVEWTHRFRWTYEDQWGIGWGRLPCLSSGIEVNWTHTWYSDEALRRNQRVIRMLRTAPIYRDPWQNEAEQRRLESELAQSGVKPI